MKGVVISLSLLSLLAAAAVAVAVIPSAMAEPFTYHAPQLIEWLYGVRSWGTTIILGLLAAAVVVAYRMGKLAPPRWAGVVAVVPLAVIVASVPLSRLQLVEWLLFAPPETIAYEAAGAAEHVAESDYVMGVTVGGESRAYPILMVAYYHIVNEEIDGEPYVVTY